jgi:hypothetical protein
VSGKETGHESEMKTKIIAAEMKFMRRTAKYSWVDFKRYKDI